MKRLIGAIALFSTCIGGVAFADTMENAYANTIVVTTADGAAARYHFNADGAFTLTTPDGQTVSGTYEVAGEQICLTPAGGERGCTQYVGDKNVGDTWTQTGIDGAEVTITLQAGR